MAHFFRCLFAGGLLPPTPPASAARFAWLAVVADVLLPARLPVRLRGAGAAAVPDLLLFTLLRRALVERTGYFFGAIRLKTGW